MIIPKSYNQFAVVVKTEYDDEMYSDSSLMGIADYQRRIIKLHAAKGNKLISREQLEQTYCHEVVHHWLEALGYDKLRKDEQFVDQIGSLLHQFLETKQGDVDRQEGKT